MIQRLQSIYLAIITLLMIIVFFLPLGTFSDGTSELLVTLFGYQQMGEGTQTVVCTWPLVALIGATGLLSFVTIFLYKNRKMQLRLSNIGSLLIFVFYLAFAYYAYDFRGDSEEMKMVFKPALILPVISLLLYYSAIRKIKADEALIRSLDRLR